MLKLSIKILAILIILSMFMVGYRVQMAQAAKGVPGSTQFGMGLILDPHEPNTSEALGSIKDLRPDWVCIPVDWSALWSDAAGQPDFSTLDAVMQTMEADETAVLLSIFAAPAWVQTPQGPDPQITAQFVSLITQRYPRSVQAIELFPRANTQAAWGSSPDPSAYVNLVHTVSDTLRANGSQVLLISGGLLPGVDPSAGQDMNDLTFLQSMYDVGGKEWLPVISIQLNCQSRDPLAAPAQDELTVMRHYELVRKKMIANDHYEGIIWITAMYVPVQEKGSQQQIQENETQWLSQVYSQLRSQLYLGTAFIVSVNHSNKTSSAISLLLENGETHPFYQTLKEVVFSKNQTGWAQIPGKPKTGNLLKNRP